MAFIQAIYAAPLFLLFFFWSYLDGTLTLREGLWLALVCCGTGAIAGILGWYLVIQPVLFRKKPK